MKKAEPLFKVFLELTDSELRELALKKVKRWTDIFLPVGIFVGLLGFFITALVISEDPNNLEFIYVGKVQVDTNAKLSVVIKILQLYNILK